jgi:hypothetical protein
MIGFSFPWCRAGWRGSEGSLGLTVSREIQLIADEVTE